jgi:hypothetical protein
MASADRCDRCLSVMTRDTFERPLADEVLALRRLARTVGRLIAANDRTSILAPRPDIAWRDVRKAYADLEKAAPSESAAQGKP